MDNRSDENLKELLERFFDSEQAQMYLDDIEKGEQILREHPAPEPDDMLIANIKAQIALVALPRKTSIIKRIEYKVAAVAAALVIITAISTSWFEKSIDVEPTPGMPPIASVFPWESSDIDALHSEVEQIEDELINLDSGGEKLDNNNDITEMEMELILIAGDFWKG
jgi:hypothetical protein